jgi:NAD(P)-dependent dehydrogenase (short-subunit alcohol dehydrogenase family)
MVRFVASQIGGRDGLSTDEWLASRANDCPMKRLAEPWEIAGVAAFLASEDSVTSPDRPSKSMAAWSCPKQRRDKQAR